MKKLALVCALGLVAFGLIACERDDSLTSPVAATPNASSPLPIDPDAVAMEIIDAVGWDSEVAAASRTAPGCVIDYERTPLIGDIVHYSFDVRIGDGMYDMIRLHRVVREPTDGQPVRTRENLFALHGSPGHFEMMFLFGASAPSVPDDLSLAIYLAQADVDVWGIDRSVNFVPVEETDLSFMAEWGMQYNVDALRAGMAVARAARLFTGSGPAPLNLLGYSTGCQLGFAAVNEEATLPPGHRQIGGFVPVDYAYLPEPGPGHDRACAAAVLYEQQLAEGMYAQSIGYLFNNLGLLAKLDPEGASPIVPGFSNRGAALFAGALTWMLYDPPGYPPEHFFTGEFDEDGLPVDLAYTEYEHYLDFLTLAQPYNAMAMFLDGGTTGCEGIGSPFASSLGAATIPVMYVGAAGGIAPSADHTLGFLGSTDVTTVTVQLLPPEAALLDIGHVDLFTAEVAVDMFWQPLLEWVQAHPTKMGMGNRRVKSIDQN